MKTASLELVIHVDEQDMFSFYSEGKLDNKVNAKLNKLQKNADIASGMKNILMIFRHFLLTLGNNMQIFHKAAK